MVDAGHDPRDGDRVVGGHRRNAEAGAGLEARRWSGSGHRQRGRQHDVVGAGAEGALPLPVPGPHPFADAAAGTPSPTMSITPAPSLCGITRGKAILRVRPSRALTSEGLTPEVASLTRTSPGPGRGRRPRRAQHVAGRTVRLVVGGAHGILRDCRLSFCPDPGGGNTNRSLKEHDPEKACPGLDPGWAPVFRQDHAPGNR